METVPYFLQNKEKVGLIQTPQSFYNQDLFQFNLYSERDIPNEQDFFSREINILRNSSNSAAYTGSNTVISRKALEEIGGFPYGTITEDFETSIRLQKAGYITYATSKVLASGLSTTGKKYDPAENPLGQGRHPEYTKYQCCVYKEIIPCRKSFLSQCVFLLVVIL